MGSVAMQNENEAVSWCTSVIPPLRLIRIELQNPAANSQPSAASMSAKPVQLSVGAPPTKIIQNNDGGEYDHPA